MASFFDSRGLDVPIEVQREVAATKTGRFDELVRTRGLEVYPDVIGYLEYLREAGIHRAVVSASEHCEALVAAAGITDYFESRVDGQRATADGLAGKPAPTPTWRRQVTSATWRRTAPCSRMRFPGYRLTGPALRRSSGR